MRRILAAALAALSALAPAAAQGPTSSTKYTLAREWVAVCQAPCVVRTLGTAAAQIVIAATAPTGDDPPATVLTSASEGGLPIMAGTAYARALSLPTSVVVMPYAPGGDAAAARVPTAAAGKATPWFAGLPANASTTLLPANAGRLAYSIQCTGSAAVAVSETGAALTTATPASGSGISLIIPSGAMPYYTPAVTSLTAITGYTGTSQSCWGVEYLR